MTNEICGRRFYCKNLDKDCCNILDWKECKHFQIETQEMKDIHERIIILDRQMSELDEILKRIEEITNDKKV